MVETPSLTDTMFVKRALMCLLVKIIMLANHHAGIVEENVWCRHLSQQLVGGFPAPSKAFEIEVKEDEGTSGMRKCGLDCLNHKAGLSCERAAV
jgi:hypothetical protein